MSALALLLNQLGKKVSGSDQAESTLLDTLRIAGIQIHIGHAAEYAINAELVVYSSAVKTDNPERMYAEQHGIPEIRRAELLGQIASSYKHTVAVAGTHGKTTTTGMCGQILVQAGCDPSILVGGILPNLKSNLRLGKRDYIVVEADEYDRSFLALQPDSIIVTTLEADHLDIYKDIQDVRDTFLQFISKLSHGKSLVLQGDDLELVNLAKKSPVPVVTYGLSDMVHYRATGLHLDTFTSSFKIQNQGELLGDVTLNMPGRHNVMNALAASALTHQMGIEFKHIKTGLESFRGVERRFEKRGIDKGVLFIDDYAHHPSEISATLEAARSGWPNSRIIAVFQPHLYSRTRDFASDFAEALSRADIAIITDIYPARERPIPGVSSKLIADYSNKVELVATIADAHALLAPRLQKDDILITLGAGDIWKLHTFFLGGNR
ncbi:MAG: UDP-N-acetylmuramate--L-alanine ligase [Candidatus Marinimicrobia bacterium]|nr:UDP-N-acetylmuramate--L-alanine ligase [Candidatus Neomarinimicrobiota bacterium]